MGNISKAQPLTKRDLYYFRVRQKNRVFADICDFFAQNAENERITKKAIAEKIGCDPALITRWLSAPSNLTLDTISDILLSMGAEMDHRIVKFEDRPTPNAAHPLTTEGANINESGTGTRQSGNDVEIDSRPPATGTGKDAGAVEIIRVMEPA